MEFSIKAKNGKSVAGAVRQLLLDIVKGMGRAHKRLAGKAMARVIKSHWASRFPGSSFYSSSKVHAMDSGRVTLDNPGVGRAFHDIDIYPINGKYLTIPLIDAAKGKSPTQFTGLFKPKGHNVLAMREGKSLVCYYALSQHVHQKQDRTILPSDDQLATAVFNAIWGSIDGMSLRV